MEVYMQLKSLFLHIFLLLAITQNSYPVHIQRIEIGQIALATQNPFASYSVGESILDQKNRFYVVVAHVKSNQNSQEETLFLKRDCARENSNEEGRSFEYLKVIQTLEHKGPQTLPSIKAIAVVTYDEVFRAICDQIRSQKVGSLFKINGELYTLTASSVKENTYARATYQKPISFLKYEQVEHFAAKYPELVTVHPTIHLRKINAALLATLSVATIGLLSYLLSNKS
jgi:hypothetical protein